MLASIMGLTGENSPLNSEAYEKYQVEKTYRNLFPIPFEQIRNAFTSIKIPDLDKLSDDECMDILLLLNATPQHWLEVVQNNIPQETAHANICAAIAGIIYKYLCSYSRGIVYTECSKAGKAFQLFEEISSKLKKKGFFDE